MKRPSPEEWQRAKDVATRRLSPEERQGVKSIARFYGVVLIGLVALVLVLAVLEATEPLGILIAIPMVIALVLGYLFQKLQ